VGADNLVQSEGCGYTPDNGECWRRGPYGRAYPDGYPNEHAYTNSRSDDCTHPAYGHGDACAVAHSNPYACTAYGHGDACAVAHSNPYACTAYGHGDAYARSSDAHGDTHTHVYPSVDAYAVAHSNPYACTAYGHGHAYADVCPNPDGNADPNASQRDSEDWGGCIRRGHSIGAGRLGWRLQVRRGSGLAELCRVVHQRGIPA